MKTTIRDVAREAGVSVATVSRAFNDSGPVHPETRKRIRDVAAAMRYSPDGAARSLITRRTTAIGVLLPDLHGEFFSELIRGMDGAARRHAHHLLVSGSHNDRTQMEGAVRAMRGRVDGLIVMWPEPDAAGVAAHLPESLPVVLLNCADPAGEFDVLTIDNFGGAHAMTRHLIDRGHRRVALLRGPERNADADERLRGYRAALAQGAGDGGAPLQPIEAAGDFTEAGGHRAALELLARDPRPSALFAANDSMAVGALSALREAGLRVPADVAVAGFDDIPMARYLSPPLSSVRVAISELGRHAVDALLHAIQHKNAHERRRVTMPTRLVLRSSCGEAPDGAAAP